MDSRLRGNHNIVFLRKPLILNLFLLQILYRKERKDFTQRTQRIRMIALCKSSLRTLRKIFAPFAVKELIQNNGFLRDTI